MRCVWAACGLCTLPPSSCSVAPLDALHVEHLVLLRFIHAWFSGSDAVILMAQHEDRDLYVLSFDPAVASPNCSALKAGYIFIIPCIGMPLIRLM